MEYVPIFISDLPQTVIRFRDDGEVSDQRKKLCENSPSQTCARNEITMATIENFQLLTVPADATFDNVL
jgi:hypothetical protein